MSPFDTLCPWLEPTLAALDAAAARGQLGHGWILSGPKDLGKRNLAYVFAGRLLRGKIGQTAAAQASRDDILAVYAGLDEAEDLHADLHRVRPEDGKASIAVDQIRATTEALALTPHIAGLKVVIIESAESMTIAAANALLKSLEEPTANTYLFLLAERAGRLPATIRSRCQHCAVPRPDPEAVRSWLELSADETAKLPARWLYEAPIAAARALADGNNNINYNKISDNIKAIYNGSADPHTLAAEWQAGDTALALDCLVDSLAARIRDRLVPERRTPITDNDGRISDNRASRISTDALFERMKMAENLREQLGRGINVELALKALLIGLDPTLASKVTT